MIHEDTSNQAGPERDFESLRNFEARISSISKMLEAKEAVIKLQYVQEYLTQVAEGKARPEAKLADVIRDRRAGADDKVDTGPLNEATVVLVCAYLEAFIEEIHEEAMGELLNEKIESAKVLQALIDYAHEHFSNPRPDRIIALFKTLTITNIIRSLHPYDVRGKDIENLVKLRNAIAHGDVVEVEDHNLKAWIRFVRKFGEALSIQLRKELDGIHRTTKSE